MLRLGHRSKLQCSSLQPVLLVNNPSACSELAISVQGHVLSICRQPATLKDFMQMGMDLVASILPDINQCVDTASLIMDMVHCPQTPSTLQRLSCGCSQDDITPAIAFPALPSC